MSSDEEGPIVAKKKMKCRRRVFLEESEDEEEDSVDVESGDVEKAPEKSSDIPKEICAKSGDDNDDVLPTDIIYVEFKNWDKCQLSNLAATGDWDQVLELVRREPKQASMIIAGDKSETALHWACYNDAPLEVIQALIQAAPHTASFHAGWHSQGTPMDCLLLNTSGTDRKDKILALLSGDPQSGIISTLYLITLNMKLSQLVIESSKLPLPGIGTFDFVAEEGGPWDLFCTILKASHYKTAENLDSLPLIPALFSAPKSLPSELGGITNHHPFPKPYLDLALRLYAKEEGDTMDGDQYAVHKILSNPNALLDNEQVMKIFNFHPKLLTCRDCKTGLYPFMLAATAIGDAIQKGKDKKLKRRDRSLKANAILDQRMVEWKSRALLHLKKELGDEEDSDEEGEEEIRNDWLYEWVLEHSQDLHGDLWAEEEETQYSTETAYYEAKDEQERLPIQVTETVDLTYRLLRGCPEVLVESSLSVVPDPPVVPEAATTKRKNSNGKDCGSNNKKKKTIHA